MTPTVIFSHQRLKEEITLKFNKLFSRIEKKEIFFEPILIWISEHGMDITRKENYRLIPFVNSDSTI